MKITLILALCAVIAFADQQLTADGSLFQSSYLPNVKHTLTVEIHNNNAFEADGSGSVSGVHWAQNATVSKYPKGVTAAQANVVTTLGPHNSFETVGAISAQSNGFAYFTFNAQVEGDYEVYVSFVYTDGKGAVKVADQKLDVIISADASSRAVEAVSDEEAEEASDAELESMGFKRQSDGTISCSQCSFAAVVGDDTYNTFGWTTNAAVNFCSYGFVANPLGVTANSSTSSAPAGGSGTYNFVLRATSGPDDVPFTLTMNYRLAGVAKKFQFGGQVSVSCPGGGIGPCSSTRSVAGRAFFAQSVEEIPLAVRVAAGTTALVAVVAAVVAVVIVRRNRNVIAAPVAEL